MRHPSARIPAARPVRLKPSVRTAAYRLPPRMPQMPGPTGAGRPHAVAQASPRAAPRAPPVAADDNPRSPGASPPPPTSRHPLRVFVAPCEAHPESAPTRSLTKVTEPRREVGIVPSRPFCPHSPASQELGAPEGGEGRWEREIDSDADCDPDPEAGESGAAPGSSAGAARHRSSGAAPGGGASVPASPSPLRGRGSGSESGSTDFVPSPASACPQMGIATRGRPPTVGGRSNIA